jgi:hypothetical protein
LCKQLQQERCIGFALDTETKLALADVNLGILPDDIKCTTKHQKGYVLTVGSEHNSPELNMQSPVLDQLKKLKCGYVLTMWTQKAWQDVQPAIDYLQYACVSKQSDGGLASKLLDRPQLQKLFQNNSVVDFSRYNTVKSIKDVFHFPIANGSAFVRICGNRDAWVRLFRSVEDSGIDHAKILPLCEFSTNVYIQGVLIENADEQFLSDLESAIAEAKKDAKKFNRGNWVHHPVNRLVLRKFLHQNPDFATWLIQDKERMSAWDAVVPVEEWKVVQPTFGSVVPEERSVAAKQVAHGFVEEPIAVEEPVCAEEPIAVEEPKRKMVSVGRKRPPSYKSPMRDAEKERPLKTVSGAKKSPPACKSPVREEEPALASVAAKQPMMRHYMMLNPDDSDSDSDDDDVEDPYADPESDASENNKKKREREPVDELDGLEEMDFGDKQAKLNEDDTRSPDKIFDASTRPVSPLTDRPIEPLIGSEILPIN